MVGIDDEPEEEISLLDPREEKSWLENRSNFYLINYENLDVYMLWKKFSGMGGESLGSLLSVINMESSASLLKDFITLMKIESKFKKHKEFREKQERKMKEWLEQGKGRSKLR